MSDRWNPDPDPYRLGPDEEPSYGDDYVEVDEWIDYERPAPRRGRRALLVLGGLAAVAVLVFGGLFVWVQGKIDPSGAPGEDVAVEVATGSTTQQVGETLEANGVISSATVWNYWTRFKGVGPFQAGDFVFQQNSSFDEAVAVLDAGPTAPETARVTIPEGFTVAEIIDRLTDPEAGVARWSPDTFRAVVDGGTVASNYAPDDVASMEGLLFPDTYDIAEDTTEEAFVGQLVAQLDATAQSLDIDGRSAALGVTPYEVFVIASLIEEEARVDADRAKIAQVIYNRLDAGMALGIDATSRYEAELNGLDRGQIDFDSDSPYNTRRVAGLPPTPIAAFGRASLEAALAPETGDLLYYVLADEAGNHTFTDNYDDFLDAKAECARLDLGCG